MLTASNIIYQGESVISLEEVKGYSRPVVVKRLIKPHPSEWSLGILQNEYNITQSIRHIKGVRKVLGRQEFRGKPALILEYIEGQTLDEYAASAQLSIRSKLKLAVSIAATLSEIHGQNIIHQDVNSRNILLSSKGKTVYICNFGIASRLEGQADIKALPVLNDGYKAGLESGELLYAGFICCIKLFTLFSCSYNIDLLLKETEKVMSFSQNTQNQIAYYLSMDLSWS